MNIAVLFGAGASFGAGPIAPAPPPLGAGLFLSLRKAYPESWNMMLETGEARLLEKDFEAGMAHLWSDQRDGRTQRLLIDMALYFTHFQPAGRTEYDAFLEVLMPPGVKRDRFVFATLNYDCIFELVLRQRGWSVRSFGQVWGDGRAPLDLLKLHGSCNYLSPMTRNVRNSVLDVGHAYVYSETLDPHELEIVAPDVVRSIYADVGASIPPAISLYEPTKRSPTGAGLIQLMRIQWGHAAFAADIVISIGTRPVAQDRHVWAPVCSGNANVWFVGGDDPDLAALKVQLQERLWHVGTEFAGVLPRLQSALQSCRQLRSTAS